MNREKIFRKLYAEQLRRDKWLDNVPSDINDVFFNNEYVDSLYSVNSLLMDEVFDEYAESVSWFLYEWKPGYEVEVDGKTTKINNIDDYIDWMKSVEGFE